MEANKADLKKQLGYECVSKEKIEQVAQEFDLKYFEVSAKEGKNVEAPFYYMAEEIKNRYEYEIQSMRELVIQRESHKSIKKNRNCC